MNDNEAIADFYRRHPYPLVSQVRAEPNLLDHIFYRAHACHSHPAPRFGSTRGRMLVAGSGTTEAVNWALSLPHFDVEGVDLSENSIAIANHLAEQMGVANLTLRRGNLEAGEGLHGPYDFISSQGVLHHLKNPAAGVLQLEKHLAPNGVMALMVYSDANRWFLQRGQRLFQLLTAQIENHQARESLAYSVCKTGAATANRLQVVFKSGVKNYEHDRPQFNDTLLNPQEVSYTIPSFAELLATAGLKIVEPVFADLWDPRGSLGPEGAAAYDKLERMAQLEVCDLVIGPLYYFVIRRAGDPIVPRPCIADDDLFWQTVPTPMQANICAVTDLLVQKPGSNRGPLVEPAGGDQIRISRNREAWSQFHEVAATMLKEMDGKRTCREIATAAATRHGATFEAVAPTLLAFLRHLVDNTAVATVDVTQCHNCPLRK